MEGGSLDGSIVDIGELQLYNQYSSDMGIDAIKTEDGLGFDDFNKKRSSEWMIPDIYKSMDVEEYVLARCKNDVERSRVSVEMQLYKRHNLDQVLKTLIYLVDFFRENKYVWGVGRGSSVSSYVLYLIGVHKVDSIKYKLDIKEFLKDEHT